MSEEVTITKSDEMILTCHIEESEPNLRLSWWKDSKLVSDLQQSNFTETNNKTFYSAISISLHPLTGTTTVTCESTCENSHDKLSKTLQITRFGE